MQDEVSTGELARRLDRIELLLQGQVSRTEHAIAMAHIEAKLAELDRDITEKRARHDDDVKELNRRLEARDSASGSNFRQAIYSGLIPGIVFAVGLLVTILLAFKGGK